MNLETYCLKDYGGCRPPSLLTQRGIELKGWNSVKRTHILPLVKILISINKTLHSGNFQTKLFEIKLQIRL